MNICNIFYVNNFKNAYIQGSVKNFNQDRKLKILKNRQLKIKQTVMGDNKTLRTFEKM